MPNTNRFLAKLTAAQTDELCAELDAMRDEVIESRGERDRAYIVRLIRIQRGLALAGRVGILMSLLLLPVWHHAFAGATEFAGAIALSVSMLAVAKILENMEIGHNVLHAQWDWMKDPEIQSNTWEWDHACPSDQWMHSHNVVHHTWTNVLGRDRDVGYGMLRVTDQQRWHPFYLLQPLNTVLMGVLFEWFIALHDLEINRLFSGKKKWAQARGLWHAMLQKLLRQSLKDYVLWPLFGVLLAVPFAVVGKGPSLLELGLTILAANVAAVVIRNLWTFLIIFCGHFPGGVHHFTPDDVKDETRGGWYVRQLLGSCNIRGGKLFHVLSGNLSHQIEHHLFPDLPSNRYPALAPRVRALATRYGLPYNSGSLGQQFGSTIWSLLRLTLPSGGQHRLAT